MTSIAPQCFFCDRAFSNKFSLVRHRRSSVCRGLNCTSAKRIAALEKEVDYLKKGFLQANRELAIQNALNEIILQAPQPSDIAGTMTRNNG